MQRGTKLFTTILCVTILFSIFSFAVELKMGDKVVIANEGVRPAELSTHDKELLQKFGLDSNSMTLLSFTAPKEAESMRINTWLLCDGEWIKLDSCGGVSLGGDRELYERLHGELAIISTKERDFYTMQITERELEFRMMIGSSTFAITHSKLDTGVTNKYMADAVAFLDKEREIVLGEPVPVAMLVYNDETRMPVYSMEHYDAPEDRFDIVDEVIAVTITFTE